jgi:hypothetical protein
MMEQNKPVDPQQGADPLDAARNALEKAFFQDDQNPWVNGISIGSLPAAGVEIAPAREILVFIDPSTPDCDRAAIEGEVAATKQLNQVLRISRFVGLAKTGDGVGYLAPFRYNVPEVSVGTLGGIVGIPTGVQYVLSSNHVLAHNGHLPTTSPTTAGATIVSPGLLDDAGGGQVIGELSNFVSLVPPRWPLPQPPPIPGPPVLKGQPANLVDCALAKLTSTVPGTTLLDSVLTPVPYFTPVTKTGHATLETHGYASIPQFHPTFIDFTFGTYWFEGMIGVFSPAGSNPPFAAPGDSGALAWTPGGQGGIGVGLITARAYVIDPTDEFLGYIILMCPLIAVEQALVTELKQPAGSQLRFFR